MPDPLDVSAWHASEEDSDALVELYRGLEAEQVELKSLWPLADSIGRRKLLFASMLLYGGAALIAAVSVISLPSVVRVALLVAVIES